jgi:ribosomal protein S18 acetylase RimI-like enzyme
VIIRPAAEEDVPAIAAIKVIGWQTTYAQWVAPDALSVHLDHARQTAQITAILRDPANVVLVAAGQAVVGFATCLVSGRPEPFLDSLHVLPRARGAGVGAALLGRLALTLREREISTLSLAVVTQNERARRLYERLGAVYVGDAPADWAPGVSEAHYRWAALDALASG